jgi:hypothetical protein
MAAVLAAAGSTAVEANTAAASFLRTMEENGTAHLSVVPRESSESDEE